MEAAYDLSACEWVRERVTTFATDVRSLVPDTFAAYARILHPVAGRPWREVARRTGRTIHPAVQFESLAGELEPSVRPDQGRLPEAQRSRLAELLGRHTTTPDRAWFCLWAGYGELHPPRGWSRSFDSAGRVIQEVVHPDPHPHPELFEVRPGRPQLELPQRQYIAYTGPLTELGSWRWYGPNLWWPDDRAWLVASEIDLDSTYVGGARDTIDALLEEPSLEVLEVQAIDSINRDDVNR